ncbi:MAG: AI-2E family transporter [bacterium]
MQNSKSHTQKMLFSIMIAILLVLIYIFKEISLLFFGSYVIACAINPIVDWLSGKMPRALAITLIYFLGLVTILIIAIPLCVIIVEETALLLKNSPTYISFTKQLLVDIASLDIPARKLLLNFNTISQAMTNLGGKILDQSLNITKSVMEGFTIIFTASIIVLYMLLDKPLLKDGVLSFFPSNIRDKVHSMGRSISLKVGGYVIGQILNMLAVAILTSIGLLIFNIKYAALLGLLAGLLDVIPIAGPFIALAIGIIVAAPMGINSIIAVIGVYILAQWLTNQFLKPALFGKLLDLHPLVIILALLIAAQTLGVAGVILSPAIAATVCVIFQEVYLKVINKETND